MFQSPELSPRAVKNRFKTFFVTIRCTLGFSDIEENFFLRNGSRSQMGQRNVGPNHLRRAPYRSGPPLKSPVDRRSVSC